MTPQNSPGSEEELAKALEGLGLEEGGGDGVLPVMRSIMESLLSKDVLYPSLKEITEKVGPRKQGGDPKILGRVPEKPRLSPGTWETCGGIMESLLSKDMLCPSLKEITEKVGPQKQGGTPKTRERTPKTWGGSLKSWRCHLGHGKCVGDMGTWCSPCCPRTCSVPPSRRSQGRWDPKKQGGDPKNGEGTSKTRRGCQKPGGDHP